MLIQQFAPVCIGARETEVVHTHYISRGVTSFFLWGYIRFCPTFLPLPDERFIECILGRNAWTTFCGL